MSWYKPSRKLEKSYTNSDKIEEQICAQRPSYDKTGLGFFLGQSTKKFVERKEPNSPKSNKDLSKTNDTPKDKENVTHFKKDKEYDQDMDKKRKEYFAWCDKLEDIEANHEGKSFKPI